MGIPSQREEPGRVDEPRAAQDYAAVLTQVAAAGGPFIVRRGGRDLAAVVPLARLDRLRELEQEARAYQEEAEALAPTVDRTHQEEAEALAPTVDRTHFGASRPPQSWFDDEGDNPSEPAEGPEP